MRSCAPTRTRWRRCSPTARRARGRSPRRRSPTCARGWAWARAGGTAIPQPVPWSHEHRRCDRGRPDAARPKQRADRMEARAMTVAALDLDLDVFSGPFDLLLTLVLREEIDLLELQLAEVVLAYLDHLESRGELDLETATEFIVLVAALLELKSRLMLTGEEDEQLLDIEPSEAAEELLARMLDARRYRSAATHLRELLAAQ